MTIFFTPLLKKANPIFAVILFFAAIFALQNTAFAQRMTVHIVTSTMSTTCTDGFIGGSPDPRWHLEVAGQGYSNCYTSGTNNFDIFNGCVPANVQPGGTVQICARFFEDDANLITGCGNGSRSCEVAVCNNYTVPAAGVQSPNYTIIGVGSGAQTSNGSVTFYLTYTAIPNDNICNAAAIAPNNVQVNGNNDCATVQTGEVDAPNPTLGPNVDPSNTVWYQFTAPANGRVRISTDHGNTNFDTEIALWQGSNAACTFNTLSFIDSDDDIITLINNNSRIDEATCLLPGTRCYVQVDGDDPGETGNFGLTVETLSGAGPAPNNFVCNAINLGTMPAQGTIGNFNLSNYTNFCANSAGEPSPGWITNGNDQGVWFSFTTGANPSAQTHIEAKRDPQNLGDNIDLQLALYKVTNATPCGTTPTFQEIDRSYVPLGDEDIRANCLDPNTTYYILVDGYRDIAGILGGEEGYFGIQVTDGTLVRAGDQICQAQDLGAIPNNGFVQTAPLSQTNVCATDTNDPTPSAFSSEQGVWYSFIAPPSGSVVVEATSDNIGISTDPIDLQVAIYETANNTCSGTLQEFQSEYDPIDIPPLDEEMKVRCLTAGRRYWLFVDGANITSPFNLQTGIFGIKIRDFNSFPAPNDEACNAIALGLPTVATPVGLNNQNNYCADNILEPIPQQFGNEHSVWYTFIAPPSGTVEVSASNTSLLCPLPPCVDAIRLQVAVFDRGTNPCSPAYTFTEMPGTTTIFAQPLDTKYTVPCLTPGHIYYILVDGQALVTNELAYGLFNLQVSDQGGQPAGANDLLCNAIPLGNPDNGLIGSVLGAMSTPHTQNNFCATHGAPEPDANGITENQTVWYSFVAPLTTNVHITIETDNPLCLTNGCDWMNVEAAVFASSDNTCNGVMSEVNYDAGIINIPPDWEADVPCLIPGNTYFVMVQGSSINREGHFDIQIQAIPMRPFPPNDLICSATALGNVFVPNGVTLQNQSNLCADDVNDPQPSAFGTDHTVWYSFTTPTGAPAYAVNILAQSASINPFSQAAVDLQLAVYSSSNNTCNGTLTEVISEYDIADINPILFPFDESMNVQCLEPNRTYFIMVDGSFNLLSEGNFSINVSPITAQPVAPNNDRCQAIALGTLNPSGTIGTMSTTYSNFCADTENGEPSPFGIEKTVWFSFTTPNGGANMTYDAIVHVDNDPNSVGDQLDTQTAVYEGTTCTAALNLMNSDDPTFSFNSDVELECLNANTTYYVQIDGTTLNKEGYFGITVQGTGSGPRPAYDNRCNAVALGSVPNGGTLNNGTIYNNYCATTENGEPVPTAFGIDKTVWFSFIAPTSGNVTIRTDSDPTNLGDDIDLQVAVYAAPAGCSGAMIELQSEYDGAGLFFDEDVSVECLRGGTTYYVQIDGSRALNEDSQGYFNITIQDDGGTTNAPYNDDICNAYDFGLLGARQTRSNENNTCASVQLGEPGLGGYATNTVWYKFIAPPSGRANIHVSSIDGFIPLSGIDDEVHLISTSNNTCTGVLNDIQSSYWPSSLIDEHIDADCLVPGNTYFVQVDGAGLITQGNFNIWVEDAIPNYATAQPANNEPCNATVVTVQQQACFGSGGIANTFNYGNPTVSLQAACNANDNCGDTWYSFTMPSNGLVTVRGEDDNVTANPIGDFSNLHINAYTGGCAALTPIPGQCTSGGQGFLSDPDPFLELGAAAGSTVWLQIFGNGSNDFGDDFQLCVAQSCGADACANAIPMTPGVPYCWSTGEMSGENVGGPNSGYHECTDQSNPEHSLYFTFQSDCNGDSLTLSLIGATIGGSCNIGLPTDGFNVTIFEDSTPCDGNPNNLLDCQSFDKCTNGAVFNWSRTYTNLTPNTTYTLMVDGGVTQPLFGSVGGSDFGEIMITTRGNPRVTLTNTAIICAGGTATLTATTQGGASPHTFAWSTGVNTGTTNTLSGVSAGTYTVTSTDARGCTGTKTITVVDTTNLILLTAIQTTPATCFASANGVATATATGGEGGFTYAWDSPFTGAIANNLTGGTHTVSATDAVGCTVSTTVSITSPPDLVLTPSVVTPISCTNGTNAVLTVSVTGGTSPYNYLWSNADATATTTNPIGFGINTIIVTDAANCVATQTINVSNPTPILATAVKTSEPLCHFGFTGVGTASATGGTPPYTYMWDAGSLNNAINNALGAGLHIVTVTDALGCTGLASFLMTEPTAVVAVAVETTPVTCFGSTNGIATASANGGTAPYTFLWDSGVPNNNAINNNLNAGTHSVDITDVNGCQTTASVIITEPTALLATATQTTPVSCFAGTNGAATASASDGTPPYTFLWDSGVPNNAAINNNLAAGTHTVTVTDANLCVRTTLVVVQEPTAILATATQTTPVLCFGGVTGVATVSAINGTPPYTFLWDAGTPNNTAINNNLGAGTHTVIVTDFNMCVRIALVVIQEPTLLTATATANTAALCVGATNGSATATGAGGIAPYTYNWDAGIPNNTATNTNLNAGTHTVTVTDANLCVTLTTVTVLDPTPLVVTATLDNNVSCFGATNGAATASAIGGATPYIYTWDSPFTGASANNLNAGSHVVSVTDANLCVATTTIAISEPAILSLSAIQDAGVRCFGQANGTSTATATGGTTPYIYVWDTNPQPTQNANGSSTISILGAGIHQVTVTDVNACLAIANVTITQPIALSANIVLNNNVLCNGGNTGSATAAGIDGTAPYQYLWDDNTTTNATNATLTVGAHTVLVTDINLCTTIATIAITQPNLIATTISINSAHCGQADGHATITTGNGTAPYTYLWDDNITTTNFNNTLNAGTHTVTITDANGCSIIKTITMTDALLPTITFQNIQNPTCNGVCNGGMVCTSGGAVAPITYAWSDGSILDNLTNACANTYTVTITDAFGCSATASATLTDPPLLTATITNPINPICAHTATGQATANGVGGTGVSGYRWDTNLSVQTATNLDNNTHTVTVTDANACTATASITLTDPADLTVATTLLSNVSCLPNTNGSAAATVTNGVGTITYAWNAGAPITANSSSVGNLAAGTYTVTVTDANGCTANSTIAIVVLPAFQATITEDATIACSGGNDGALTLNIIGASPLYTQLWSNNENTLSVIGLAANTYTVTVTDANNCTQSLSATLTDPTPIIARIVVNGSSSCGGATGSATASVTSGGAAPFAFAWANGINTATNTTLAAGTHIVTVTDASGCMATASCQISQNSTLAVNAVITTPIACFGNTNGVATATATGGTAPYTYEWDNGTMDAVAGGLSAGLYTVIATDALNCSVIAAITLTEPDELTAAISNTTNTTCSLNNGSATVNTLGGSPNYTYAWDNLVQTASTNTLSAGIHTVTVTDTHTCSTTVAVTITADAPLRVTVVATAPASCNLANGGASANGLSGTLPYSFDWDNGIVGAINTTLTSGTHVVTITDATGCTATSSIDIINSSGLSITLAAAFNPTCHKRCDGRATIAPATGGTAPYSYLWVHNQTTTLNQNGLCANTYTVIVRDALGCTSQLVFNITEPNVLDALANIISPASCGNNGVATAIVSGGTTPYTYLWDTPPAFNGQTNTFLSPGQHTLTVTDANACSITTPLLMPQIAGLRLNMIVSSNVSCFGQTDGIATANVINGASPYLYAWDNAETTATNTLLGEGIHTVTVTDAAGCVLSATLTIAAPLEMFVTLTGRTAGCNGTILGSALAFANGGTPGYIFQWSHGPSGNNVSGLAPNIYTVYVTDSHGCTLNTSITIGDSPAPTIDMVDIIAPICNGDKTGSITLTSSNGVAPLSYNWLTSPPLPAGTGNGFVINNIGAGLYFVTVTDAIGCAVASTITMQEPLAIAATTTLTKPFCIGDSNGSITVASVTNGISPYLYSVDGGISSINNDLTLLSAGAHTVLVTDANNCTWTKVVTIPQPLPIAVNAGNDRTIALGDSVIFNPVLNSFAAVTYQWSAQAGLSCYTCRHPTAKPLVTTTYIVTVTDTNGCTATDALTITVMTDKNVYIPNSFTPNNDGINDNFTAYGGNAIDKIQLIRVYDRWGELVYQGAELATYAKGWDGTFKDKTMNSGVFVYYIQVRFVDGEVQTFTGDVTLVN